VNMQLSLIDEGAKFVEMISRSTTAGCATQSSGRQGRILKSVDEAWHGCAASGDPGAQGHVLPTVLELGEGSVTAHGLEYGVVDCIDRTGGSQIHSTNSQCGSR